VAYLLLARFSQPKAEQEARLERELDAIQTRAAPAE
jgi:HAE1 family hydrophobic/amphiphilic exporter-1